MFSGLVELEAFINGEQDKIILRELRLHLLETGKVQEFKPTNQTEYKNFTYKINVGKFYIVCNIPLHTGDCLSSTYNFINTFIF